MEQISIQDALSILDRNIAESERMMQVRATGNCTKRPRSELAQPQPQPPSRSSGMNAASKQKLRERLSKTGFVGGEILLDGNPIGRFVTYGKESAKRSPFVKNVYGSRIYHGSARIEVEATTSSAMLNKVAAEIAKAIRKGTWVGVKP